MRKLPRETSHSLNLLIHLWLVEFYTSPNIMAKDFKLRIS